MTEKHFDIASVSGLAKTFDDGFDLAILHPVTNEKLGLNIRIASYRSDRVKRVQRVMANKAIRENKKNPKKVGTVEETEEKTVELVAAAVISWDLFENGKPLECSQENVLRILSNPDLYFIGEQIDKAADEDANFIKPSPKK